MDQSKGKSDRGFVADIDEVRYTSKSTGELSDLLKSQVAIERTVAARILSTRTEALTVEFLLAALKMEQKLYPKLELCHSLAKLEILSVPGLVKQLGTVGKNQHSTVSIEPFKKKSYPLPRDIAARTLIRIGVVALPALCDVLQGKEILKISEAIDAIGFICYQNPQQKYLEPLLDCYTKYPSSDLIRWKILRAMSAFPASLPFLEEQLLIEINPAIIQEIKRSIRLAKCKV